MKYPQYAAHQHFKKAIVLFTLKHNNWIHGYPLQDSIHVLIRKRHLKFEKMKITF